MSLDMICKNKHNKPANPYWNYVLSAVVYWSFFAIKITQMGSLALK